MSLSSDIAACHDCKGKNTSQLCERHRNECYAAQARCPHRSPLHRAFDGYICGDCGKWFAQGGVVARYYAPGSER